jgi:hypothetical protein
MTRLPVLAALLALGPALAAAAPAPAPAADPTVEVEATGEAAVVGGSQAAARDRATEDALRRAVEQAAGTLVSSQTEVRDSQLVSDRILTHARGYVRHYDVLETRREGGTVVVRIKARVGTDQLSGDLAAIGITLARKGMPRLALLIAEQRIDDIKPAAWWGNQSGRGAAAGGLKVDQRVAENTFIADWQPAGFTFVDMDALAGQVRQAGIVTADLNAEQVREIKNLSGCDVVITGSVVATKEHDISGMAEQISGFLSKVTGATCTATISVRAVNADNGEILAAEQASERSYDKSPLACGRDATEKATRKLAGTLQARLLATWSKQLDAGSRLTLTVAGVDTLGMLNALVATLKQEIRGVKEVQQRRFSGGSADLDVTLQGSAQDFASALEEKTVKGRHVEVTGLSANTVELRLVR